MTQAEAGADSHDHHDPHVAHHYESAEQQFSSGKLGMWAFLATEILMFGGLFCGYAVWRHNDPVSFEFGHLILDTNMGAINTLILISSSFTMAWAVRAAQLSKKNLTVGLLCLTLLGGLGFMVVKYLEYSAKWHHGTLPGQLYNADEVEAYYGKYHQDAAHAADGDAAPAEAAASAASAPAPRVEDAMTTNPQPGEAPQGIVSDLPPAHANYGHGDGHHPTPEQVHRSRRFIDVYFLMTGLHGIHVLVGMGLIAWIALRAAKGAFSSKYFLPVDLVGLYWHLVDLIWIFLFPLSVLDRLTTPE
jgi:cytochrome c oxidase subunit 3